MVYQHRIRTRLSFGCVRLWISFFVKLCSARISIENRAGQYAQYEFQYCARGQVGEHMRERHTPLLATATGLKMYFFFSFFCCCLYFIRPSLLFMPHVSQLIPCSVSVYFPLAVLFFSSVRLMTRRDALRISRTGLSQHGISFQHNTHARSRSNTDEHGRADKYDAMVEK